jgi:hypothetical protein
MIERLQHALEHVDELSPEAQEELAQQIEELTIPAGEELSQDYLSHLRTAPCPHARARRLRPSAQRAT